jgi:ATP-binding cassette subfamily B protein
MILAPLLMSLEVAMDLMQPMLIERIVDLGIANLDLALVVRTGVLMIGLALIGAVGGMTNGIFAVKASQGFGADLRDALFRKVQTLSFANLDELSTGQLVTNLTNDVTQVQLALHQMLRILIRGPLLLVVLIGVLLIINRAYPLYTIVQEKLDALNTVMQENLAGVRIVKAFVRRDHETQRFGAANEGLMGSTIRVARVIAVTMPFAMLAMNLGLVGVIWFGGIQVTIGGMQTGQIISFVNYLQRTLMSLLMVSMIGLQVSRAEASARRIAAVLDTEPAVRNRPDALQDHRFERRVTFDNVCFSYDGGTKLEAPSSGELPSGDAPECGQPVLRDVSFVAEPGETVALLGTTGAGKSSLVHLIPRFYDVDAGRVTIDGIDVRDVDKATLRRNIGIALRETLL